MPPKKNNDTDKLDALLASITEDMLGDDLPQHLAENGIRVERILLEMVRPDPVQPRRVLPERIHFKFHEDRMTPTQALRELVQFAQVSARQQGRPFTNVLELLPDPESDTDEPEKLSPEEDTLRDLVNLAVTIRDDGQVNPLTVVDVSQGVTRLFRIETGERRYWAAWLLRDFFHGYDSDGMIDCIVVPAEKSSVFRQAKENTARKGLTAMAMARQAALLLLTVHEYEIPLHAVNNDFYRQALNLDLRGKSEFKEAVLSAMGGIGKMHFSHYKSLLRLSDEAWELADRHNLDEFRLRPILQLPEDAQGEMVQHIIQFNLSGRQVREICARGLDDEPDVTPNETPTHVRRFVKVMRKLTAEDEDFFVQGLLNAEVSHNLARAHVENVIAFLVRVKARLEE